MTRIRKITKVNIRINVSNDIRAEKILDKSIAYVNLHNKRTSVCKNKNKIIIFTLKSYPDSSLRNDGHLFEEKTSTISTQTGSMDEQFQEINKDGEKQSKLDYSLLRNRSNSHLDSILDLRILTYSSEEYKEKVICHKNIIILHKNENLNKSDMLQSKENKDPIVKNKRIKNQTQKIFGTKYPNRKYKRQFPSHKIKRKSIDMEILKNKDYTNSYHQIIDRIGKYGRVAVVKWSSKFFKVILDLGVSLTESFKKFYKYMEYQRCLSLNNMCNCLGHRQEINHLVRKFNQLESRFNESQYEIKEHQKKIDITDNLDKKMEELEQKLESYYSLKSELDGIKKQLNGSSTTVAPPIPPPLPPPPPPLPTFSQTKICSSKTILKALQSERRSSNHENTRPIITLEDILNVKLKKIAITRN